MQGEKKGKKNLQKLDLQKIRIIKDSLKKVKGHVVAPGVCNRDVGSESIF